MTQQSYSQLLSHMKLKLTLTKPINDPSVLMAKKRKLSKCPSDGGWMNKLQNTRAMEMSETSVKVSELLEVTLKCTVSVKDARTGAS